MPASTSFATTQAPSGLPGPTRAAAKTRRRRSAWRWLRSFMGRRLRLERRGLQIHVLLEPPAGESRAASAQESGHGAALRRDHEALQALLARRPELRLTMRTLGYLEQSLAHRGSRALKGDPPRLYAKALDHLERIAREEPGLSFPELERRLRDAARVRHEGESDFSVAVEVKEASHSLFDEMERSWTGQIPPSAFDSTLAADEAARAH